MSEPHGTEIAPVAKNDAEKVEESLRDFIGRVIRVFKADHQLL